MKESRRNTKKAQKENWYLNIIVLPQLDNINNNYFKLTNDSISYINKLEDDMESINIKKFKIEQAKIKNEIKKRISQDFDHIISLVRSYNKDIAENADNTILKLQDECTHLIDRFDQIEEAQIRSKLLENKEMLISILNSGLNIDEIKKG